MVIFLEANILFALSAIIAHLDVNYSTATNGSDQLNNHWISKCVRVEVSGVKGYFLDKCIL